MCVQSRSRAAGQDIQRLLDDTVRKQVVFCFQQLGYLYVTLDLQGYRTGSMNEVLKKPEDK